MDILINLGIVILVLIIIAFLIIIVFALIPLLKAMKKRNDTWKELSPEEKAKYKELKKRKGA